MDRGHAGELANSLEEVGVAPTLSDFLVSVLGRCADRLAGARGAVWLMDGAACSLRLRAEFPEPTVPAGALGPLELALDDSAVAVAFSTRRQSIGVGTDGQPIVSIPVFAFGAPLALFRFDGAQDPEISAPAINDVVAFLGRPVLTDALLHARLQDAQSRMLLASVEPGVLRERAGEFLDKFRRACVDGGQPEPDTLNFQAVDWRRNVVRTLMADGLPTSFRTIPALQLSAPPRPTDDIQAFVVGSGKPEVIVGNDTARFSQPVFLAYGHINYVRLWVPLFPLPAGEREGLRVSAGPTLGGRLAWTGASGGKDYQARVGTWSASLRPPPQLIFGTLEVGYRRRDSSRLTFAPLVDELAAFCVGRALELCEPLYAATLFGALEQIGRAAAAVALGAQTEFTCFVRRQRQDVTWRYPVQGRWLADAPAIEAARQVAVFDGGQFKKLQIGPAIAGLSAEDLPAWSRYRALVERTLSAVARRAVQAAFKIEFATMRPHELQDVDERDDPFGTRGIDAVARAVCAEAHLDSGATSACLLHLELDGHTSWRVIEPAVRSPFVGCTPVPTVEERDFALDATRGGRVGVFPTGTRCVMAVPLRLNQSAAAVVLATTDNESMSCVRRWLELGVGTWTHRLHEHQLQLAARFTDLMSSLRGAVVQCRAYASRTAQPGKKAATFVLEVLKKFLEIEGARAAIFTRQVDADAAPSATLRSWLFKGQKRIESIHSVEYDGGMGPRCSHACASRQLGEYVRARGQLEVDDTVWRRARAAAERGGNGRAISEIDRVIAGDTATTLLVLPVFQANRAPPPRAALSVLVTAVHHLRPAQRRSVEELGGLLGDALATMVRADEEEAVTRHRQAVEDRSAKMATAKTLGDVIGHLFAAMGTEQEDSECRPWGLAEDAAFWIVDRPRRELALLASRGSRILPVLERARKMVIPAAEHPLLSTDPEHLLDAGVRYRRLELATRPESLCQTYVGVERATLLLSFAVADAQGRIQGIVDCLRSAPLPPAESAILGPLFGQLGSAISSAAELSRLRTVKAFAERLFERTRRHLREARPALVHSTAIESARKTLRAVAVDLYVERGARMILISTTRDVRAHLKDGEFSYQASKMMGNACVVRAGAEPPSWAPRGAVATPELATLLESETAVERLILPRRFHDAQGGVSRGIIYFTGPPQPGFEPGEHGAARMFRTGGIFTTEHLLLARDIADEIDQVVELTQLTERQGWLFRELVHSLGQPIQVARGCADSFPRLMRKGEIFAEDVEEMEERLDEAFDMVHLAQEKLGAFLKIGATTDVSFVQIDLASLLRKTCVEMAPMGTQRGNTIETRVEPCTADVDPVWIRLALLNLVENAIKYSFARKHIEVSLRNTSTDDIDIYIVNHGTAIPPEDLETRALDAIDDEDMETKRPMIFLPYYRSKVPDARGTRPGTGVGLAVVWEAIVRIHGGWVSATSRNLGRDTGEHRTAFLIRLNRASLRDKSSRRSTRREGRSQ